MGHFVTLTPHPVTVRLPSGGDAAQPLWTVVDVSGYDILDLELGVFFLSGRVTARVFIETSMQNQSDEAPSGPGSGDWQVAAQFPQEVVGAANAIPKPQWQKLNVACGEGSRGFLKYVRWRVNLNREGAVTFFIRGMARRWA
jgi:hypothetical protein